MSILEGRENILKLTKLCHKYTVDCIRMQEQISRNVHFFIFQQDFKWLIDRFLCFVDGEKCSFFIILQLICPSNLM